MSKILLNYELITTSPYGPRDGGFHGGIDLTGYHPDGYNCLDYICAKEAGTVIAMRNTSTGFESGGSYGNYVKIDHGNGYQTLYAHMAYGSVKCNVGDRIEAGQVIGYMGATGTAYGGHLHFEVRKNDQRIDPTDYAYGASFMDNTPTEEKKSLDTIVDEVIAGEWGNWPERQQRLEAAGYNYEEVQSAVNARFNNPAPAPEEPIKEGDLVVVNGIGTASSDGSGARTRMYSEQTMKVIDIKSGATNAYALNQYAQGNVKDYSQVTAWFNKDSIRRA